MLSLCVLSGLPVAPATAAASAGAGAATATTTAAATTTAVAATTTAVAAATTAVAAATTTVATTAATEVAAATEVTSGLGLEAIAAVHWPAVAGFERHLGFFATGGARCGVEGAFYRGP